MRAIFRVNLGEWQNIFFTFWRDHKNIQQQFEGTARQMLGNCEREFGYEHHRINPIGNGFGKL